MINLLSTIKIRTRKKVREREESESERETDSYAQFLLHTTASEAFQ